MPINIIHYKPKYASIFYELNIEWLKTYFYAEPYDEKVLSNPLKYIINKGGFIFFAEMENQIVGTVALMPTKDNSVFELTKMAVSPDYRGQYIGQKLMLYCINFGFVEIPVEDNCPYERCNIKMELVLQH